MVADELSHIYALISTLSSKLLWFKHIKKIYANDSDVSTAYNACEHYAFQNVYRHDGFLLRDSKLYVPNYSLRQLLVREAHNG